MPSPLDHPHTVGSQSVPSLYQCSSPGSHRNPALLSLPVLAGKKYLKSLGTMDFHMSPCGCRKSWPHSGTGMHTDLDSLGQSRAVQSTCVGGLESVYADTLAPLCFHPVPSHPDSQESSGTPAWPHLHKLRPLSPNLCNALAWAGLRGGRHQQSWR